MGLLILGVLGSAPRPSFNDGFMFVFIDERTERAFNGPPFDRSLYAGVVDRCRELGAKGVVIKLFLDREHTESGDQALAGAMARLPVIMQARIEPQTGRPDDLPVKFVFEPRTLPTAEQGDRGWLPIPRLAAVAADIGFVDFAGENIPLLEVYRGKTYKSVVVCALELQSGARARLGKDNRLMLGDRAFPTAANFVLGIKRSLDPLPACGLSELLSGEISPAEIRGKVVIFGWIGAGAGAISTAEGRVPSHVYFGQCLRGAFERIDRGAPGANHAPALGRQ